MIKNNSKIKICLTFILSLMLILCFYSISFATYSSIYPEPSILIRKGSSGTGVKWLQDMLNHNRI